MNRRTLLRGLAGVAGGLILPAGVADAAEAGRRVWALGAMPDPAMHSLSFSGDSTRWMNGAYISVPSSPTTFTVTLSGPPSYYVGDNARLYNLETRTYEDFVVLAVEEHSEDANPLTRLFGA